MPTEKHTEHCMVCGSALDYLSAAKECPCTFCGRPLQARIACPEGHVVCDTCHGKGVRKAIEDLAASTTTRDPMEIAELMMASPELPMLSCDHAYIAAGALLAAMRNSPYSRIANQALGEVFDRTTAQAHGGYCGLTGVCGIAPAIGACVSVFLGARCGTDREQRIVMEAVARVTQAIADLTGPSCCKAYVRTALATAADLFSEKFGVVLPVRDASPPCTHSTRHPHGCREERCPYYRKPSRDVFAGGGFIPGTVGCVT